jgi:hypothetical protein
MNGVDTPAAERSLHHVENFTTRREILASKGAMSRDRLIYYSTTYLRAISPRDLIDREGVRAGR